MPTINLGRIQPIMKGDWDSGTTYTKLDGVSYQGSSYMAYQDPPVGTVPTDTAYWQLMSQRGVDGSGVVMWGNVAGSFTAPLVAMHQDIYYVLLEDVTQIENEVPGVSPVWRRLAVTPDIDGLSFDMMVAAGNYDEVTDTGFFGEVSASTLFTGPEIKAELGITEGTPMNDAEPWLKFWHKGEVLYVNKKPIQHSISWNHIDSRGAALGTPVEKNGYNFTARLLTGAASNPIDTTGFDTDTSCELGLGAGSEWNNLIYRVHQDIPVCADANHLANHGGAQDGANWSAMYTDADLGVVSGNGRSTWCQETDQYAPSRRVRRGHALSVAWFSQWSASSAETVYGLRLVLALNS